MTRPFALARPLTQTPSAPVLPGARPDRARRPLLPGRPKPAKGRCRAVLDRESTLPTSAHTTARAGGWTFGRDPRPVSIRPLRVIRGRVLSTYRPKADISGHGHASPRVRQDAPPSEATSSPSREYPPHTGQNRPFPAMARSCNRKSEIAQSQIRVHPSNSCHPWPRNVPPRQMRPKPAIRTAFCIPGALPFALCPLRPTGKQMFFDAPSGTV
jgi:hypothetical protein